MMVVVVEVVVEVDVDDDDDDSGGDGWGVVRVRCVSRLASQSKQHAWRPYQTASICIYSRRDRLQGILI